MTEYTTQRSEYKGHALLEIWANDRKVMSFGARKAEAILETMTDIENFALEREQTAQAEKLRAVEIPSLATAFAKEDAVP